MQISPISLFKSNTTQNSQINQRQYFKRFQTLAQDTVSFSGKKKNHKVEEEITDPKNKIQTSKKDEITKDLAQKIYAEAEPETKKLENTIKHYLSSLVTDENNPDRIILPGKMGIHGRTKDIISIAQKSASTGLRNKAELKEKMKDIVGERIVLRTADRKSVDKVIQQLIKAVNNGDLVITEIENYRPLEAYSYPSEKTLQDLYNACIKKNEVTLTSGKTIPSGYTALHLTTKLKNGFYGEIQIMGRDVEQVKEVEDIIYKIKNHKALKPKYQGIENMLAPYFENDGSQLKKDSPEYEEFKKSSEYKRYLAFVKDLNAYTTQLYVKERKLEPYSPKIKTKTKFEKAPSNMLSEFDFNELYKLKAEADKNAEKNK